MTRAPLEFRKRRARTQRYSASDLKRAYTWLAHQPGMTELCILHPDYRPGDTPWNNARQAWPITRCISTATELATAVHHYAGERLICYGLNPRPRILTHPDGRCRSAKETDIAISQTLLLDIDLQGTVTPERLRALVRFLGNADEYCTSIGINRPVRASTGRGSHLLFAYPAITIARIPTCATACATSTRASQPHTAKTSTGWKRAWTM